MAIIVWTVPAVANLESIYEYICQDSQKYAALIADEIVRSVKRLELFPKSGRIVPEINEEDTREIIYRTYRIVYRIKGETVEVLTVHHSSRIFKI